MNTITIAKDKYNELMEKALRYDRLYKRYGEDIFACPPTKSAKEAIGVFERIGIYNKKFLKSLAKGLDRSSYFKHEDPAAAPRTPRLSCKKKSNGKIRKTKTDL